jgi:hypothetical protein
LAAAEIEAYANCLDGISSSSENLGSLRGGSRTPLLLDTVMAGDVEDIVSSDGDVIVSKEDRTDLGCCKKVAVSLSTQK